LQLSIATIMKIPQAIWNFRFEKIGFIFSLAGKIGFYLS
jgi:hypothetical protein